MEKKFLQIQIFNRYKQQGISVRFRNCRLPRQRTKRQFKSKWIVDISRQKTDETKIEVEYIQTPSLRTVQHQTKIKLLLQLL